MSDKLLPCPFCGGEAVVRRGNVSKLYYVRCSNIECAASPITDGFSTEGQAARAWNRRAERTCHYKRVTFGDGLYLHPVVECDSCGQRLEYLPSEWLPEWVNYCPSCGAKVIEEGE